MIAGLRGDFGAIISLGDLVEKAVTGVLLRIFPSVVCLCIVCKYSQRHDTNCQLAPQGLR